MKRIVALLLTVVMALSLVACGGNNKDNTANTDDTQNTANSNSEKKDETISGTGVEATNDAETEYAKELTISLTIGSLDPGVGWNAMREGYQRFVFDSLLAPADENGELKPQLAKTVEWDGDGADRIHVVLRDDVVFSNGDPVTAADVEFSLARSTYYAVSDYYESCEIVSDTELYINLNQPNGMFFPILSEAGSAVVCKTEAEKDPDGLALIGSGPYVYDLDTHVPGSSFTVRRNELYWGEQNPTEVINFVTVADASAAAVALQNGDIDMAFNLNTNELPQLENAENVTVYTYNSLNFIYMSFNDYADSSKVTEEEKNFRRAVACAINKEDIIAGVGGGIVMASMWDRSHPAYLANESDYEDDLSYNPEKAAEYLAKAGGKTEFTCLVDTSRSWCKLAAQVMQEYLRQVGITMNIEETDSTGFSGMTKWNALEYDASLWSNLFTCECGNWGYYTQNSNSNRAMMNDPELNEALAVAMVTTDDEERNEAYRTMQKEIHESVSWLPLIWREMNYATTAGLEGFRLTAGPTYDLRDIRLPIK